jgi:radical SAM superfamily enzyme YgiQ (UPF0313 family)
MARSAFLFNPPSGLYRRDDRCQSKVEDQTIQVMFPPLPLAYAASALRAQGYQCRIVDYPAEGKQWDALEADLRQSDYSFILIGATYPTLDSDLKAASLARKVHSNAVIAARGEIFSISDKEIMAENNSLDFVLRGECEETLGDYARETPLREVAGITWRDSGKIVRNPDRSLVQDLDNIPPPARDLLNNSLYRSPENGRVLTTIETARGCPYGCIFCSVSVVSGKPVRQYATSRVISEIEECVNKYSISEFLFHADTFTYNREWVLELCQVIIERGIDIRWGCNSRADTIDRERLEGMRRAGCHTIGFGIESGDDKTLKRIKKGATAQDARNAIKLCREMGVRSHAFMVAGFPWDTIESLQKTVEFVKELNPDFFDLNLAHPLPGTEMWKIAEEAGLLVEDSMADGGYGNPAMRTESLTQQELVKWRKKALLRLYLRPTYIGKTLLHAATDGNFNHFVRAGKNRLKGLLK